MALISLDCPDKSRLFHVSSIEDPVSLKLVKWVKQFNIVKYFKPLARLIRSCCKSLNTNCNTYIKLTAATTARRWCCQKVNIFTKKWTKLALNEKVCFFAFSNFNTFFGTRGHIPAIFNLLDLMLSALSHSQSPQHSKTYLQSLETKLETHFILWQSRGNLFHFS